MDSVNAMYQPRKFRRARRMPRVFAVLIARCLALVLVAGNLAAAGVPIGAATLADMPQAAATHHHCDSAEGLKTLAHAKHATGCACCDGQGCHCLQSVVALAALWRVPAAIPRASATFTMHAPMLARRDISPHWRPPIV